MRKIDLNIFEKLKPNDFVFKISTLNVIVKKEFEDPNINKDFEKYMLIKKENGEIRLSKVFAFTHEMPETIVNLNFAELQDGTWWVHS